MIKKTIFTIASAIVMLSSGAFAQDIHVEYQNLISVLAGYHGIPGADYWGKLDQESTRSNLIKMANDEKVFTVARARALYALTYFDNDEVRSLMLIKAKSDPAPYMRAKAYEALGSIGGVNEVDTLGLGLTDEDVMVRLASVRALRKIGGPKARMIIERSLKTEKNKSARSVFLRTLEIMK